MSDLCISKRHFLFSCQVEDVDDEVRFDRRNWYNHSTGTRPVEFPLPVHTVYTLHQNTSPGLVPAGVLCSQNSRDEVKLKILDSQPLRSQSHLLSAGVAVGCCSDDGGGGRGLLDGGEADVRGAMQVAGLALRAGTSTTSQLTEEEERLS